MASLSILARSRVDLSISAFLFFQLLLLRPRFPIAAANLASTPPAPSPLFVLSFRNVIASCYYQMHTDMGDERGIRPALHLPGAHRPSGITDAWHGSVRLRLGISDCQILSLDRSF